MALDATRGRRRRRGPATPPRLFPRLFHYSINVENPGIIPPPPPFGHVSLLILLMAIFGHFLFSLVNLFQRFCKGNLGFLVFGFVFQKDRLELKATFSLPET